MNKDRFPSVIIELTETQLKALQPLKNRIRICSQDVICADVALSVHPTIATGCMRVVYLRHEQAVIVKKAIDRAVKVKA